MIVVGMVSTYRDGRLALAAIESLIDVELDALYLYEGPAGTPLEGEERGFAHTGELPSEEMLRAYLRVAPRFVSIAPHRFVLHRGRWRTDGRKRNEMLQRAKKDFPQEKVWAVVVDADEVLVNGRYLRDRLEWILANDEQRGASIADPVNPPMARWPLRLVEYDGSMSLITARVFRIDLLRSIDHSSSVVTNVAGVRDGWGNYAEVNKVWLERWLAAVDRGATIAWPPLPCEPHLVHRSNLRHPARAGLRMSDQEAVEFARAQAEELADADR